MMFKASLLIASTCLLLTAPYLEAKSVVVQKSVSVKSPTRQTSVINHFNPAGHVYAATGGVLIDRDGDSGEVASIPQSPSPIKKDVHLARTVSVKSPKKATNVVNHFNPEGHDYAATGNVEIHRSSSPLTSISKSSSTFQSYVSPASNNLHLERTVSVKSPERVSSVINHFSPAQHLYAATGNVVINRASAPLNKETIRSQVRSEPTRITKITKVISQPVVQATSPQFNLEKTVSVKSPTRATSVIDHFNPAGHKYDAEGNVIINRGASAISSSSVKTTNTFQPAIAKVTTTTRHEPAAYVAPKQVTQFSGSKSPSSSDLHLERTVSVKSPNRVSSVISHFSPAQHVYAATGNVVIDRHSSPSFVSQKHTPSQPETIRTQVRTEPAQITKITKVATKPVAQFISPQLNLERTVSVKSPTRATSVIDHFNPAGHKYDAEGNVIINRGASAISSSSSSVKTINTFQPAIAKVTTTTRHEPAVYVAPKQVTQFSGSKSPSSSDLHLERTVSVKSPDRVSSVISHFSPAQHVYAATGNVVIDRHSSPSFVSQKFTPSQPETIRTQVRTEPAQITKITKVVTKPAAQFISPQLNLERTVSVKSPTRATSVIDHFNPAGHIYDAEGNVIINRGASAISSSSSSVKTINTFQPAVAKVTTTTRHEPAVYGAPKQVTQFSGSKSPSSSDLHLERTVSVKSPDRVSSVISHFSPAQHVYAATGNVVIDRHSSPSFVSQKFTPSQPETIRTQVRTEPAQITKITKVVTKPAAQFISPQLNLERTVSVKSPTRATSVIDHFNPAGHKYDAEGNVIINRGASAISSSSSSVKTINTFQPAVAKVTTTTRHEPAVYGAPKQVTQFSGSKTPSSSDLHLERTVSVKSPDRVSSVISHFSPAQHVYAATGNVVIDRHSSPSFVSQKFTPSQPETIRTQVRTEPAQITKITKVVTKPAAQFISPQLNLERTVSVKSPTRATSVIDHFNPAGHKYDAEGNVIINRGASAILSSSSSVKTINTFQPAVAKVTTTTRHEPAVYGAPKQVTQFSGSKTPSSSDLHLERTVSVKSPDRVSSVISHFSPAQHVYAATGNVVIDRHSSPSFVSQKFTPSQPETIRTQVRTEPAQITKITKVVTKPAAQFISPQLNLERTVSVKSPTRATSVIDHFNPAGHKYDAEGNVIINRGASAISSSSSSVKTINTFQPAVAKVTTTTRHEPAVYGAPKQVTQFSGSKTPSSSDLHLERTVSVKSPDRVSSVISHFSPAQHIYAATGNVVIDRHSSKSTISQSQFPSGSAVVKTQVRTEPSQVKVTKVKAVESELKKVVSKVSDEKSESVKSPSTDREESSEEDLVSLGSYQPPSENFNSYLTPSESFNSYLPPQESFNSYLPPDISFETPKSSDEEDDEEEPKPSFTKIPAAITPSKKYSSSGSEPIRSVVPSAKVPASGLKLEKSVSVKVPEHRISPIDHFNPASHKYAATGAVTINKSS